MKTKQTKKPLVIDPANEIGLLRMNQNEINIQVQTVGRKGQLSISIKFKGEGHYEIDFADTRRKRYIKG